MPIPFLTPHPDVLPYSFVLQPRWCAPGQTGFPEVSAVLWVEECWLRLRWSVRDSPDTFRCEVHEDGGPVWQDSCVEIFLDCLDHSGDYCNFEFNSRGFCLAARGPDRQHRRPCELADYAQLFRRTQLPDTRFPGRIFWELEAGIPRELLGCDGDLRKQLLRGNIHKCGDKTAFPHYLSAFPIRSPRPDFHRPGDFFNLLSLCAD